MIIITIIIQTMIIVITLVKTNNTMILYLFRGYYSSGSMGNYYDGYSDNFDYNYGLNSYVHDQLYSPKDQWDERIVDFQAQFKNETM